MGFLALHFPVAHVDGSMLQYICKHSVGHVMPVKRPCIISCLPSCLHDAVKSAGSSNILLWLIFSPHLRFPIYADYCMPVNCHYRPNSSQKTKKWATQRGGKEIPSSTKAPEHFQKLNHESERKIPEELWTGAAKLAQGGHAAHLIHLLQGIRHPEHCSLPLQWRFCLSAPAVHLKGCPLWGMVTWATLGAGGRAVAVGGCHVYTLKCRWLCQTRRKVG